MTLFEFEDRDRGKAPGRKDGIVSHLFYHCMRKKAMNLLLRTLPIALGHREIKKYFFRRGRIGDFKHDIGRLKKHLLQEVASGLERGERGQELLHGGDLIFPGFSVLRLTLTLLLAEHPNHLEVHVERLVDLVPKAKETPHHKKNPAGEGKESKEVREWHQDDIEVKRHFHI
jgi:hypothetical protein